MIMQLLLRLPARYARSGAYIYYACTIGTHLLVLAHLIPYNLVSGGRSPSYSAQAAQSVVSIVVLAALALLTHALTTNKPATKWRTNMLYALSAFWFVGLLAQFAGTEFERLVLAPLLLVGFICHLRLAVEARQNKS